MPADNNSAPLRLCESLFFKPAPAPAGPSAADLLAEAKGSAPMGVLVGQATGGNQASAERSAINQLKRAMNSIAGELVDAQVASGRVSGSVASDLKTNIATALDRGSAGTTQKVGSGADSAGKGWAIYSIDKASALQTITSAVNAAKENVAAGNFNPNNGFDEAYAKAAAREWK